MTKEKAATFDDVHKLVNKIPYGKVSTYDAIAAYLGFSERFVRWAIHHTEDYAIPKHRVVARGGYTDSKVHFENKELMKTQLKREGVPFSNDQILNFKKYFWDPIVYVPKKKYI